MVLSLSAQKGLGPTLLALLFCALLSGCGLSRNQQERTDAGTHPKQSLVAAPSPVRTIALEAKRLQAASLPLLSADPSAICSSVSYRDRLGRVRNGSRICAKPQDCRLNGERNCLATGDYPTIDLKGIVASSLGKIHSNLTIFELSGSMPTCSASLQTSCYSGVGSLAIDPAQIDPSRITTGYAVLGISGSLPDCSASRKQNCRAVAGRKAAPLCSENASNCFVPLPSPGQPDLRALDFSELSESVIKKGAVIAGITGQYPSSSYPLDGSLGTDIDLSAATGSGGFAGQLRTAQTFVWFDREGHRYQAAGDPDILGSNIISTRTILETPGTMSLPGPSQVRAGTAVGTGTGRLLLNCRNGVKLSAFDIGMPKAVELINESADRLTISGHGLALNSEVRISYKSGQAPSPLDDSSSYFVIPIDADVIALATSPGAAAIDIISAGSNVSLFRWNDGLLGPEDSIDDQNGNRTALVDSGSGPFCSGIELTAGDGKPWKDVTPAGCDGISKDCIFEDTISGLQWSEASAGNGSNLEASWGFTVDFCEKMVFGGHSDWRMPTQKEVLQAYVHNMRSVNNIYRLENQQTAPNFWVSTASSDAPQQASWQVSAGTGQAKAVARDTPSTMICVRQPL